LLYYNPSEWIGPIGAPPSAPVVEAPSIALAFAAGFISFVSPCCLPLVPGYLATVSGTTPTELQQARFSGRILGRSALFVATFSLLFILLGLAATALGSLLLRNQQTLSTVAGIAIIVMGALFVGSVFITSLNRDFRPDGLIRRAGKGGPVIAGAAFAIAWTPCIGPTLGAILGLAATQSGTLHGAFLLAVYSAGLAVPFLLSAVAFGATTNAFAFFRRHYAAIQVAAGLILVAMGVLVLTGELFRLNIEAQQFLDRYDLNFFKSI
jgi:cytochrome c-type biogenesis protein